MSRRCGLPDAFRGVDPGCHYPVGWPVPDVWHGRGRCQAGPMHTFVDDWRQEFFWRRPEEGRMVASAAGDCTAPDYSVWLNDPPEWAEYQAWRSAMVAGYWQAVGVRVMPVVSFRSGCARYVPRWGTWAIRGPDRSGLDRWLAELRHFLAGARCGRLVVFGRCPAEVLTLDVDVVQRPLRSTARKGN